MGPKNQNLKQEYSHFSVFVGQNWMKNGQVMTMRSARQSGAGYFLRYDLQTYFAQYLD